MNGNLTLEDRQEDEKWRDSNDPDSADSPPTKAITGSKSSKVLLGIIKQDKSCQFFKESSAKLPSGIIGLIFFFFLGTFFLVFSINTVQNQPTTILEKLFLAVITGILYLMVGGVIYTYYINTLFISKVGVGQTHHRFSDTAIRWEHISHIAIDEKSAKQKDSEIYMMWIYGNKRKIIFQNPWWSWQRFTYSILKDYIPDLDNWVTSRKKTSRRNLVRYRKTE